MVCVFNFLQAKLLILSLASVTLKDACHAWRTALRCHLVEHNALLV